MWLFNGGSERSCVFSVEVFIMIVAGNLINNFQTRFKVPHPSFGHKLWTFLLFIYTLRGHCSVSSKEMKTKISNGYLEVWIK